MVDVTEGLQGLPDGEAALEDGSVAAELAAIEAERQVAETPAAEVVAETPAADPDQTAEPTEEDDAAKKAKAHQDAIDKRFAELTKTRYAEKRRADGLEQDKRDLEERLRLIGKGEVKPGEEKPPSEEERRREVEAEARRLVDIERFNADCNRTLESGQKDFPDFEAARVDIIAAFGSTINRRPDFLEAINEIPDGHKVFYHLGKNLDEADRVLRLPPTKMAIELTKLSSALGKPPAPKPVSKVPAPITPIGGTGRAAGVVLDDKLSMDKWSDEFIKSMR